MSTIFSKVSTWIALLLAAILVLLAGTAFGWWSGGGGTPGPSTSASPTVAPTGTSGTPSPSTFVARPVTMGTYVPSAVELTAPTLASAGSGWVVAINDTTQLDTSVSPATETPDVKILYLIDPAGTRYELANLDSLGLTAPNLVAWDYPRAKLLLKSGNADLKVFDMASGAIESSWTFCAEPGWVGSGQARAGNWLVRGNCQGTGIDAIYTDAGATVPSDIVGNTDLVTVRDVGPVQVLSEFETGPDERFIAYYPDGTSAAIPSSVAGDCYMLGKGRGMTLAVYCYSLSTGGLSIWELPVDLSAPYEVVSAAQLEDFAMAAAALGPSDFWITDYCSDSALGIVQFALGDESRLGVLYGGTVEQVGQTPFRYRVCHDTENTAALVSGDGHLWWTDFDSGTMVVLLPGESAGSPIQVVGSDKTVALRQP